MKEELQGYSDFQIHSLAEENGPLFKSFLLPEKYIYNSVKCRMLAKLLPELKVIHCWLVLHSTLQSVRNMHDMQRVMNLTRKPSVSANILVPPNLLDRYNWKSVSLLIVSILVWGR